MKRDATDTKEDIQSLARAHGADAIAVLAEIMNNTDAPAGARLSAAKALLERGWGKPGAKPPEEGNRAAPVSQIKRVIVYPKQDNATQPSQSANAASLTPKAQLYLTGQRTKQRKKAEARVLRRGLPLTLGALWGGAYHGPCAPSFVYKTRMKVPV